MSQTQSALQRWAASAAELWYVEQTEALEHGMTASFYDRRSLLELTRRWNELLAVGGLALRLQGASAIEEWKRHAVGGFLFLASDGSRGGTVELCAPLVPEQVLDQLGVGDGWLIAPDLSWAVHADHGGFLPVRLFGNPDVAALTSSDTS